MNEQGIWVLEPESARRRMFFQRVDSPDTIRLLYLNCSTDRYNSMMNGVTLTWMDNFLADGETMIEGEAILVPLESARKVWQYLIDHEWKSVLVTQKETMA